MHWAILIGVSVVPGKSRPRQPGWYRTVWTAIGQPSRPTQPFILPGSINKTELLLCKDLNHMHWNARNHWQWPHYTRDTFTHLYGWHGYICTLHRHVLLEKLTRLISLLDSVLLPVCCVVSVPSQMIVSNTIKKKPDILMSITTKIVLQMNCKMGGELWAVKIPVASSYLCSLLCLHQARLAGGSIHYFFYLYIRSSIRLSVT